MARKRRTRTSHQGVKIIERALPSGGKSWVARWTDPETKRQVQQSLNSLGLRSKEARREWAIKKSRTLSARQAELSAGAPIRKETGVKAALEKYLETIGNRLRPGTIDTYRTDLAPFNQWLSQRGVANVEDLVQGTLMAYALHLAAARRQSVVKNGRRGERRQSHERISPATINRRLRSVKTLLNHWRKLGLTPKLNRDDIADTMKALRTPKPNPTALSRAQCRKLLFASINHDAETFKETREEHSGPGEKGTTPRYAPITPLLVTTLLTGCRLGELLGLRWEQVELNMLNVACKEVGGIRLGIETKTHSARLIDLSVSPALRRLLSSLRSVHPDDLFVFGGDSPASRQWAESARKRLKGRYGAPAFTWQMLRQTCGSYLVCASGIFGAAGVYLAARQLGHSISVAERHYLGVLRGIGAEHKSLEAAMGIEVLLEKVINS